jgi:hypothetical protein
MTGLTRRSRVLASGLTAGVAGVLSLSGAIANAEPVFPQPPPAPATVTQPAAGAAAATTPQALGQVAQPLTPAAAPLTPAQGGLSLLPPATATITPATTGTLADFFKEHGVTMEPQNSQNFHALNIVLPVPKGWAPVPDPNVPDAFAVIADRVGGNGLYTSNAQLVVYKLVGQFDPREAISHGFVDSQQLPAWRTTDGSLVDFGGMPSSVIEGTYRENAMTLNTSRRHVIATVGPDNYLLTLSVTTSVDQVVAAADATDAIVRGFRVTVPAAPGATPQGTVPAAPPGAAAVPATPPTATPLTSGATAQAPQLLGLSG